MDGGVHQPQVRLTNPATSALDEVVTTCADDSTWIAVVTGPDLQVTNLPHMLEIDAAKKGGCDPCVIGNWTLDLVSINEFVASQSQGANVDVRGSWTTEFLPGPPDGALDMVDRRNLQFFMPDLSATMSVDVAGTGTGPYTADGNTVVVSGYTNQGAVSTGGLGSPFNESNGGGGRSYVCEGDLLVFDFPGGIQMPAVRTPPTPKGNRYF
ncbi:MAG TPA: hypothetical protein PK020_06345 [Ilumatobacteraceae bacterium]|nr:hypothetical protein [Ilumatobacteraceae bacterium]HRB04034.1 hypothetical protein [Ilumatobacteraceae bacterium]